MQIRVTNKLESDGSPTLTVNIDPSVGNKTSIDSAEMGLVLSMAYANILWNGYIDRALDNGKDLSDLYPMIIQAVLSGAALMKDQFDGHFENPDTVPQYLHNVANQYENIINMLNNE